MEEAQVLHGCCHKTKERPEKEYRDLINRLNRIEGQIRGIRDRKSTRLNSSH